MLTLAVDSLVAILFAYATGAALLRALRLPWTWAVIGAPAVSLCVYALLGEAYYVLGVPATPRTVCLYPLVVFLTLSLMTARAFPREHSMPQADWRIMALYACVGLLFGYFVFLRSLPHPDAVFQKEDICKHALQVQAFIDSRCFSSLHSSIYQDSLSIAPHKGTSFYPCAWHTLCALVAQLTGSGVPVTMNAVNYVLSSLVYPISAFGLLSVVLDGSRKAIATGALACVSIIAFPWALLVFGPLYPNLGGIACLPITLCFFMLATTLEERGIWSRLVLLASFCISSIGMALSHPNAVFSAAVFLIPYCCHLSSQAAFGPLGKLTTPRSRAVIAAFACAVIWILLRYSPALEGVVSFNWTAYVSRWQSLLNVLSFAFLSGFGNLEFVAQPVIAIAAIVGAKLLFEDSERAWMVASHAFACLICMVCMSTEGELKHLLGGFWYTDPYRLAATAAVTALPLVALGLSSMASIIAETVQRRLSPSSTPPARHLTPKCLALCLLAFLIVMPTSTIPGFGTIDTAFTNVRLAVKKEYALDSPYSSEERAFVAQAKELMGEDALVINNPLDGSILAYGFDDLNCYYRARTGYDFTNETEESSLIRLHLCDLASEPDVRSAIDAIGAEYVIILDSADSDNTFLHWYWFPEKFEGITSIDPTTPGFELVLVEDGMCLYRIAA